MARNETDREDLMREASALIRRVELHAVGRIVVAGFARSGRGSVYFDADPALHFDAESRLRRAYFDGYLWRTQGTHLARMERERRDDATELVRRDLSPKQSRAILIGWQVYVEELLDAAEVGRIRVAQSIPSDDAVLDDVLRFLTVFASSPQLAPRLPGKP